jgi:hypothetical protein
MRLKDANYEKEFTSQTNEYKGKFNEGLTIFQRMNQSDRELREEIIKKFEIPSRNLGFDGKIFYSFNISDNLETDTNISSENLKYITTVQIKKTGKENHFKTNPPQTTDLGKFLLAKGFKKLN